MKMPYIVREYKNVVERFWRSARVHCFLIRGSNSFLPHGLPIILGLYPIPSLIPDYSPIIHAHSPQIGGEGGGAGRHPLALGRVPPRIFPPVAHCPPTTILRGGVGGGGGVVAQVCPSGHIVVPTTAVQCLAVQM